MRNLLLAAMLVCCAAPAVADTIDQAAKLMAAADKDPLFIRIKNIQTGEMSALLLREKKQIDDAYAQRKANGVDNLDQVRSDLKPQFIKEQQAMKDRHVDVRNKWLAANKARLLKAAK